MNTQQHIEKLNKMADDLEAMALEAQLAGMEVMAHEYRFIIGQLITRAERMKKIVKYVDEANQMDLI